MHLSEEQRDALLEAHGKLLQEVEAIKQGQHALVTTIAKVALDSLQLPVADRVINLVM